MKLAVASADGISISNHFGRSKCFLVYEIRAGRIQGVETRAGSFHVLDDGACEATPSQHGNGDPHDYQDIVAALEGCQAVLCLGMGWRAAQELVRCGINPLVIQGELSPQEAVQKYIDGELTPAGGFCRNTGRPASGSDE